MNSWFTADWHLGEERLELMNRPFKSKEEHIEQIVSNHNEKVLKDDIVYVNGDVCYKNSPESLEHVGRMNGRKILLRGNHDRDIPNIDFLKYFESVIPEGQGIELYVEGIKCYVTHYPTQGKANLFNLVGHIHSVWKCQLNMLNVGLDVNHFYPFHSTDVAFYHKAICDFYDKDVWCAYNLMNGQYGGIRGKQNSYFSP